MWYENESAKKKHYSGLFTTKQQKRGLLMDWEKVFSFKLPKHKKILQL